MNIFSPSMALIAATLIVPTHAGSIIRTIGTAASKVSPSGIARKHTSAVSPLSNRLVIRTNDDGGIMSQDFGQTPLTGYDQTLIKRGHYAAFPVYNPYNPVHEMHALVLGRCSYKVTQETINKHEHEKLVWEEYKKIQTLKECWEFIKYARLHTNVPFSGDTQPTDFCKVRIPVTTIGKRNETLSVVRHSQLAQACIHSMFKGEIEESNLRLFKMQESSNPVSVYEAQGVNDLTDLDIDLIGHGKYYLCHKLLAARPIALLVIGQNAAEFGVLIEKYLHEFRS